MATLNECRRELRSIISELHSIEDDVRASGYGLGQDLCADCIGRIADRYQSSVMSRLDRVDTNRLADWINGDN